MTRVRVRKVGVLLLAVPAVLAVGSGAARAAEVPRFDPPGAAVLAGTTSFPGTVGTLDLDAFTFGTTAVTTPFTTAAPSEPSLVADVTAQPADKGDKEAAGKVPMGGCLLFGRVLCPSALALLPGITNPVFFDGVPEPVRDAVWRAMATYSKETVVKFFQTPNRDDATVVVRMGPSDPTRWAATACLWPTWHGTCAQKEIIFNADLPVLPTPPSLVHFGCDRSDLSCRKEEADAQAARNRNNQRENAKKAEGLYSTAMHKLGHVVGLDHTDDTSSIITTVRYITDARWPTELLPEEIKAINQAYSRYLTMPTPQPQPVPRPSGFK